MLFDKLFSELTKHWSLLKRNPYPMLNIAFEDIDTESSLEEGLQFGLRNLRKSVNATKDRMEAQCLWVLFNEIKSGSISDKHTVDSSNN